MPNSKISRTTPETQGESHWEPPRGVLGELTAASWKRAEAETAVAEDRPVVPSLSLALRQSTVSVIAEIKRSSPSRGSINPDIDTASQARAYEAGGASAISVLTEPSRFGGAIDDIRKARGACTLPLLAKDFHVTESQLITARNAGASAALVIVRAIDPVRLPMLAASAREIGIELLFEVRDETELTRALDSGAELIGVNNRNLETLEIDSGTVERIVPLIPKHCVAIAESGYSTRAQIEVAGRAGSDAVLIGSSLSAAADPAAAVAALTGVGKASRD